MNKFPRVLTALCVSATAAVTAFAAPNAKWVPTDADFAITARGLDVENKTYNDAWEPGLKKLGFIDESKNAESMKQLEEACPGITNLIKVTLGADDDFKKTSTKSILFTASIKNDTTKPEDSLRGSTMTLVLENPKADINALETAIREVMTKNEADELTLTREGEWLTLRGKEMTEVIAITKAPEGYLLTLQENMEKAQAVRDGKVKSIKKGNPLMKAFAPLSKDVSQNVTYVLKDLSELINRLADPATIEQLKTQNPELLQIKDCVMTCQLKGAAVEFKLTIAAATPEAAQKIQEACLGYKMIAQMMGPQMLGKPDSKLIAFISNIACKTEGNNCVVSCVITPENFLPVLEEIKALQSQTAAPAPTFELDDEEDEEEMTAEEAKAILDALEIEE
jgi:hypothetical protein